MSGGLIVHLIKTKISLYMILWLMVPRAKSTYYRETQPQKPGEEGTGIWMDKTVHKSKKEVSVTSSSQYCGSG